MSSEWPIVKLGTLADFQEGYVNPSQREASYFEGPVKWLRATDLNDGVVRKTSRTLSEKGFRSAGKSAYLFEPGTLAISKSGTIGRLGLLEDYMCGNRAVINIKPKENSVPRFIFYILKHLRPTIEILAEGSVQKNLYVSTLANLDVPAPNKEVQHSFAEILGILDDRITLLRETNTTLEAIAQALFKSWFVDFDPVHAKQQGRAPEGMDAQTAALFPDSFEESELGMVPKGWRVGKIADICSTISNGSTPSRSKAVFWENGSIPWFKTGELSDGFLINSSEFITHEALSGSSVKIFPKFAVLMAIYAAPTVGRLGILTEEATFNQACTGMVAKENIGPWFLFWTLFNGRDWFNSRANGAAQQNISKAIVAAYELVIPNQPALDAFNRVVSALHESILLNSEKVSTLSKLRDTLLPRLISGQLRLPEAGQAVAQAIAA